MPQRIRVENLGSGHVWIPSLELPLNATNAQVIARIEQELGCVSCFLPGAEGIGERIDFESEAVFPEDCAVVDLLKICPECQTSCQKATRPGHLECLRYVFSHSHAEYDNQYGYHERHNKVVVRHTAGNGNLAGLEYLFEAMENEWTPDETATEWAVGHLDCLQFLHEHGCPLHKDVCRWSACNGKLDCLRYTHEHGASWGQSTTAWAAEFNNVKCLAYAMDHGCPVDKVAMSMAAKTGSLECVTYLCDRDCPFDEMATQWAARNGHLDCLQYLCEHGCPFDARACKWAASNGHLKCLTYLHEHGCPWNSVACAWAAAGGHLDCLAYLHEHGCPWTEVTVSNARNCNHQECLDYALQHGCPHYS